MTDQRLIDVPDGVGFLAIRDEYLAITGDACAAALLDFFERFSAWKRAQGREDWEWVYGSQDDLVQRLRGIWSKGRIKQALAALRAMGWLEARQHKPNSFEKQLEYRFIAGAVQAAITDWSAQTYREVATDLSSGSQKPIDEPVQTYREGGSDHSNGTEQPIDGSAQAARTVQGDLSNALESINKESLLESGIDSSSSSPLEAARASEARHDDDDTQAPDHPIVEFSQPQTAQSVYAEYADNIQPLTPFIRDQLIDAVREFGEEAVRAAIRAAVTYNARNWAYIDKCLKNGAAGRAVDAQDGRRFISGEFAAFIEH